MGIVEIKTGKVERFTCLQTAGQYLLVEGGTAVQFEKDGHIYTLDGRILPSITQILTAEGIIDPSRYTESGRNRGTMAHLAIHLYDTGQIAEEEIDAETEPYLRAWISFRRDTGFEVVDSEKPLASVYGYAGTPDKVGNFTLLKNPPKRMALQLIPESNPPYKIFPHNDIKDFNVWLAVLAVYQWKKGGK